MQGKLGEFFCILYNCTGLWRKNYCIDPQKIGVEWNKFSTTVLLPEMSEAGVRYPHWIQRYIYKIEVIQMEEEMSKSSKELIGKVALVTGASRGIGRGIARKLASLGATVLINYNGSEQKAQELAAEIAAAGGQAECIGCDVSDFAACADMVEQIIGKFGHVDILVNNAGVTRDNLLMRMSEEDYDKVLDINLKGAFNTMRHLSKYFLKQRSGKIVNISSVSGVLGNAGQANYSASKAGLIGLTKSVARELASRGVCVNAVAPGFIDTDMTQALSEKAREAGVAAVPMGRIGSVEDIAEMVAFLAGNRSDYITGQVICVDGGMAI